MEFNGRELALRIYKNLKQRVQRLKLKNITPRLVVLNIGNNPSSLAYIRQKIKWGEYIGALVQVESFENQVDQKILEKRINKLNTDPSIHALIIQLPLPSHLDSEHLTNMIDPAKDIDGFQADSLFTPPLAVAVVKILGEIFKTSKMEYSDERFLNWLSTKNVVILGKGKAGGKPIIDLFRDYVLPLTVIDSKTKNVEKFTKKAQIIISAVGKEDIIKPQMLTKGVILIGVGMTINSKGKLKGDYTEENIKSIAATFTPVPGGVGPVNVACLLENLINACESSKLIDDNNYYAE